MAASLNKVELLGVLAREPEFRQTATGETVSCFSLKVEVEAVGIRNELAKEVCYVDVEAGGPLGQLVQEYFHKDSPVFVDGRLKYESYIDRQSGRKMSRIYVSAQVIQSALPDNAPVPEPPANMEYDASGPADDVHPMDGASGMSF